MTDEAVRIRRKELLLLLLSLDPEVQRDGWLGGITRLQKLLFLLEQEGGIRPTGSGYEFVPYKAGPYSLTLYDDLEFLENLDLIETEKTGEATLAEAAELERVTFEELGADLPISNSTGSYEERRFRITEKGRQKLQKLLGDKKYQPLLLGIRAVKGKYAHYSLRDLLYHVYTKYPQMTTESEIKNQVLSQGRRR